jgi:hypothetical protein
MVAVSNNLIKSTESFEFKCSDLIEEDWCNEVIRIIYAMGIMKEASIIEMLRGEEIEKENERKMKAEELDTGINEKPREILEYKKI